MCGPPEIEKGRCGRPSPKSQTASQTPRRQTEVFDDSFLHHINVQFKIAPSRRPSSPLPRVAGNSVVLLLPGPTCLSTAHAFLTHVPETARATAIQRAAELGELTRCEAEILKRWWVRPDQDLAA